LLISVAPRADARPRAGRAHSWRAPLLRGLHRPASEGLDNMCFSPEVSFSLAAGLAVGGGYCVRRAVRIDAAFLPLAAIPSVFAVQQFCEGWVWTGVARGDPGLTRVAALSYLFFALLFWPIWIPFSMLLVERSPRTRWFLRAMTVVGMAIGLGLMVPVVVDPAWLTIGVIRHSIHYNVGLSPIFDALPGALWQALYLLVVSTPLFVSSLHKLVHCGVAVIVSAAATHVFFDHAFASVWCFFAAALSLYLCVFFSAIAAPARREAGPIARR
jgi:hypothetical protein